MRRAIAIVLLLVAATAAAQTAPKVPHTFAGKKFSAFLAAFNSGDRAAARHFIAGNYSRAALAERSADVRAAAYAEIFRATGGLEPRRILQSDQFLLIVLAQSRSMGDWLRITFPVEDRLPFGVKGVAFEYIVPPSDVAATKKLSDAELASAAGDYLSQLAAAGQFAGAVLIAHEGKAFFEKAYGTRGDPPQPLTVDSPFGLASIGKTFTAVAIAQLVETGKLRFSDTVNKFFPTLPHRASRITIDQLLTHTAGLPLLGGAEWFKAHPVHSESEYVPLVFAEPPVGEPGGKFSYSNGGYMVLAGIVERVSGQPYAQYVATHILTPAGMDPRWWPGSTVGDMLRYANALLGDKLLRAETLQLVLTDKVDTDVPGHRYAYGFMEETINGARIVGHDGGASNVSARFEMYPATGYTVVIMSSRGDDSAFRVGARLRTWLTQP